MAIKLNGSGLMTAIFLFKILSCFAIKESGTKTRQNTMSHTILFDDYTYSNIFSDVKYPVLFNVMDVYIMDTTVAFIISNPCPSIQFCAVIHGTMARIPLLSDDTLLWLCHLLSSSKHGHADPLSLHDWLHCSTIFINPQLHAWVIECTINWLHTDVLHYRPTQNMVIEVMILTSHHLPLVLSTIKIIYYQQAILGEG